VNCELKKGVLSLLVITRKKGESILIGDDIEISISKIEDGSVKLAIKAPKEMTILRKELYEEVQNQNKEATKMNVNINLLKNLGKK
jgi:carbon storage regulator